MTHDPMCPALEGDGLFVAYSGPVGGSDHLDCLTCAVIARVREDERANTLSEAIKVVEALKTGGGNWSGLWPLSRIVRTIMALGGER